jgi:DNA-directed RNA polymerase subunit RPC12/RpoP
MNARSNRKRFWIVLTVTIPFVVVATVGVLNGQQPGGPKGGGYPGQQPGGPKGGGPPGGKGGIGPGPIENVWTCTKCGKEAGRGAFAPANCPHCGVKFINGVGKGGDQPFKGNPKPEGPGVGGGPGPIQHVWTCSNCKKQAGTGTFAPDSCPHCGTKFINGMGGPTNPGNGNPQAGGGNPGVGIQPVGNNPPGGGGNPLPQKPQPPPQGSGGNPDGGKTANSAGDTADAKSGRLGTVAIVAIIGGGVVAFGIFAAAIGVAVWFVMRNQPDKKKPRRFSPRRLALD